MDTKTSGWLGASSLAIPNTAKDPRAAWKFVSWATSKQYIRLVGEKLGWARVPPGSRLSTYKLAPYVKASSGSAPATLDALKTANVDHPGLLPVPYKGIQYVGIPE